MNQQQETFIGIEIGGTKLQVVASDAALHIKQQVRYTVSAADGAAGILAQIKSALLEIKATAIAAVGVGFGGPVNAQTGVIQTSHQVEGWSHFPLKDWLQQRTGAPVVIDNDANVAALAEALHGAGKRHNPVFYMTIGSGIGGGVVVDGKIYHGALPGEVEIGHLRLTKAGNTLESECSGWAVNKKIRTYIDTHPKSLLTQLAQSNSGPEALLLQPALHSNDPDAQQLLAAVADDLAFALSHVVHLFHPQVLIIGGGLSLIGEPLRHAVAAQLPRYVMSAFLPAPEVVIATLGENVVPIGALQLAKDRYFEI